MADRLAAVIRSVIQTVIDPGDFGGRYGAVVLAEAIRGALADGRLTPEDLGMARVAGKDYRGSAEWSPHRFYDCATNECPCSLLYVLPSGADPEPPT